MWGRIPVPVPQGVRAGFALPASQATGSGEVVIPFAVRRTQAKRIAFLVDYSGSMEGPFRKAMEKRLEESLKALPAGIRSQTTLPGGTDWRSPFHYAMEANPPPDAIFSMTDGQIPPDNIGKKLAQIHTEIQKVRQPPVVNCLWIENPKWSPDAMKKLAARYQGEFREIDKNGVVKEK